MKVLIIEDDERLRRTLAKTLTLHPFHCDVFQAPNGLKGVHSIQTQSFDLIICDLDLPYASGLQVARERKEIGIDAPFVLFTHSNYVEPYLIEKLNITKFVSKSKPGELLEFIRGLHA